MTKLIPFLKMLRPEQWYKNLLVFAVALFSHNFSNLPLYPKLIAGFLLLSLVSGSSYILNDVRDIDADRVHPRKALRPLASGVVTVRTAFVVLGGILVPSLLLSYWLNFVFGVICTTLFLLNVSYTIWLKRVVIADVLAIAVGFVARGIAGGVLISVPLSSWFVYGVFFAALLLALGKRSGELRTLESAALHRSVLGSYGHDFLLFGMTIASTLVVIFYTLYVTLGPPQGLSLLTTVPIVVFIVFRYFYLASSEKEPNERAEDLFYDGPTLVAGAILVVLIVILLYVLPQST